MIKWKLLALKEENVTYLCHLLIYAAMRYDIEG